MGIQKKNGQSQSQAGGSWQNDKKLELGRRSEIKGQAASGADGLGLLETSNGQESAASK